MHTTNGRDRRVRLAAVNISLATAALFGAAPLHAETLRIATWNLGWHVAKAELPAWMTQCAKT